ncbi:hypothetical protein [Aquipseudomonas campi]
MKHALLSLLLLSFLSSEAFAKSCKNSQPCGNSCISWNKTCRIGSAPSYSAPSRLTAPTVKESSASTVGGQQVVMPLTDAAFVMGAPSMTATKLRRLKLEDSFMVFQKQGPWVRITPTNLAPEWVHSDYLTP